MELGKRKNAGVLPLVRPPKKTQYSGCATNWLVQPDGNLAVAVVNNKSRAEEISLQFSKALGVRLKRRLYNPATIVPDEKAAFLELDQEFDCDDHLTDIIPPNAVVVYSTL